MAEGLFVALANAMLDGTGNGLDDYPYLQMHTGAPGAAGTANVAGESTRILVSWDAAVGGSAHIAADIEITTVAATETWRYFTAWTAGSGGTPGLSGVVAASAVTAGDDVTIAAESVTATFALAS